MKKNKGILLVVISALIYGFTPVLCAYTYQLGNNSFTLTFFRSFMVVPVLAIIMLRKGISFRCTSSELIKIVIVALFGSVLTTLLLYSSYNYIGVGTTTTLHFLYPLFVMLICHFVYHDSMKRVQILALIISLAGVSLFIDPSDFKQITGIGMALFSGITFALYLIGIEKLGLSKMNSYKLSFYLALTVAVTLMLLNIFTQQLVFNQPLLSYGIMAIVAVLAQLVAVICLKAGIDLLGSALASLFSMFEPISSVIFGAVLLQEAVGFSQLCGCVLILMGVLMLLKK